MDYVMLVLSVVGIALFLWLFTGELTAHNGRGKLLGMARFSYLFALTVMTLVLASFKYPALFAPEPHANETPAIGVMPACVVPPEKSRVPAGIDCERNAHQWVINIGGVRLDKTPPDEASTSNDAPPTAYRVVDAVVHLQGGLVVPLYVVIVALMGGTVSMTRRVPEIQKQAWRYIEMQEAAASAGTDPARWRKELRDSSHREADGDSVASRRPITLEYAREALIFQIMQVVSAPIVAMIAYYLFEPDTQAMSIAIAFIAGFASESVLIGIRQLATGLVGNTRGTDTSGNTSGRVPDEPVGPGAGAGARDQACAEDTHRPPKP